jgi:hypothetical protein
MPSRYAAPASPAKTPRSAATSKTKEKEKEKEKDKDAPALTASASGSLAVAPGPEPGTAVGIQCVAPRLRISYQLPGSAAPQSLVLVARVEGSSLVAVLPSSSSEALQPGDATVEASVDGGGVYTPPVPIKLTKK